MHIRAYVLNEWTNFHFIFCYHCKGLDLLFALFQFHYLLKMTYIYIHIRRSNFFICFDMYDLIFVKIEQSSWFLSMDLRYKSFLNIRHFSPYCAYLFSQVHVKNGNTSSSTPRQNERYWQQRIGFETNVNYSQKRIE